MTEAGWTREPDFTEVARKLVLKINEIQPDQWDQYDDKDQARIMAALKASYRQGRVAGIKQGIEKLREREKFYTEQEAISEGRMRMTRGLQRNEASCCAHELERLIAQAAQDEKEVGDANTKG